MNNQTKEILSQIDEKLKPLVLEIEELKRDNSNLKNKLEMYERKERKKNLIIFGIKEMEQSQKQLLEWTVEKFKNEMLINVSNRDIDNIFRIGKGEKDAYITEDFPKEVLAIRKQLQEKMMEK
ncbi:unnamed protein product [Leptidea sinapis]|uniref:Uncharacterized protein n=1 Tax=Leptidea sinapis TaxID=189913 RepID=A0A5E4PTN9_9NEOP|nr:unnamed protein product [Leptidea sinapis]